MLYEQILSRIHHCLGDEPQEVLKSVTDEVLAELKIDNKKDQVFFSFKFSISLLFLLIWGFIVIF